MNEITDICWEEVQQAAAQMFSVWVDGTELEWAKEAWSHLHAAGLTGGDSILEVTESKIRLVTVARIYHEFCGLAWEENPEIPVNDLAEKLDIDPTALGLLVPKDNIEQFDSTTDNYDLREAALIEVTDSQRAEIFECLKAAYGGSTKLYTRLWHTRSPSSDEDSEDDEFEVSGPNDDALRYVLNGFQEG